MQLWKQGIRWPVSVHDHIVGLELIEVAYFFEVDCCPATGFPLDRGLKPRYYSKEDAGALHKDEISARMNLAHCLPFFWDIPCTTVS